MRGRARAERGRVELPPQGPPRHGERRAADGYGESSSALATCCIWLERARRWLVSWSTWLGLGLGLGIGIG